MDEGGGEDPISSRSVVGLWAPSLEPKGEASWARLHDFEPGWEIKDDRIFPSVTDRENAAQKLLISTRDYST